MVQTEETYQRVHNIRNSKQLFLYIHTLWEMLHDLSISEVE